MKRSREVIIMSGKFIKSLSAGLAVCIVLSSGKAPKQERYSFFLPSPVIKNEIVGEEEKLLVLDGDCREIEYTFKLAEIFHQLFDKYD